MSAHRKSLIKVQGRETKGVLRSLFENATDAIATFSLDGRITSVNRGAERLLGWSRKDLVGQHVRKVATLSSVAVAEEHTRRFLAGEKFPDSTFEVELIRKDGSIVPVEARIQAIRDKDGTPIGFQGIYRDISARKRTEEALVEQARLSSLDAEIGSAFTKSEELANILHHCAEALVRHLNAAFARIWMVNKEGKVLELLASAGQYTHTDGPHSRVPMGESKIGLIAQACRPYQSNSVIGDPRIHDQDWARREGMVAFAGYPLIVEEQAAGVLALFSRRPLTAASLATLASLADKIALGIRRKRAEDTLRQSEEYFRSLIENALDIITLLNSDGTIRYGSPAIERVFGYTPEDLLGKSLFEFVHPDDARDTINAFGHVIQNPGVTFSLEFRLQRKDGSWCLIEGRGKSLLENPAVAGVVLNIRDITDRRRAEENIRRAKQEWETTSDAVSDLIILTDLTGKILRCNRAVSDTFSIPIKELIGLPLTKVFYDSADAVAGIFTPQLSAQALLSSRREDVYCLRLERWFAVARHPLRPAENETLQGFVYLLSDITERKRMEDMLRGRVIQPRDLPTNLREFRKSLKLSQKAFGQEFGGYSQRQINSYESEEIEIPISLLLAIKNRGYSLDVLFAPSQADAINNAIGALATNQKTSAIVRQLLSAVLRVLDQEHVQRVEVLAQLGTPQSSSSTKESDMLRTLLQRLGLPGE